jgi:precorrin-8X/cobalt-precorrin-8 methylmutase
VAKSLFDSYMIVDWSAAGVPKTGENSIWIALVSPGCPHTQLENPATRAEAMDQIVDFLHAEIAAGRRVLAGFDFPFGYPVGSAKRMTGKAGWESVWDALAGLVEEGPKNATNRFDVGAQLNELISGTSGPFWGNGLKREITRLPRKRPDGFGDHLPAQKRAAENHVRSAQEVWKLSGAGSVGSQALTGIAALARLRRDPGLSSQIRVWPFETGLAEPKAQIVLAEIYPSLLPPDPREAVKDAGQVRAIAERFSSLDAEGILSRLFNGPAALTSQERIAIQSEESWILGAGFKAELGDTTHPSADRVSPQPLRYERDPHEIYRQSFAVVRAETRLDHLPADLHEVAIRLVHSCGMTDLPNRLAWSDDVAASARNALAKGAPILCDSEMVASGIVRARLPADNPVVCTLNDPATPELSATLANTRSAAAVELWRDHIEGAMVVIGNAPTALFHLLELLDRGLPKPAVIIGFPVGFVGAAESKAELAANPRGIPFLTLRGRRGGSAMAAAIVNAMAAGLEAPR